MLIDTLVDIGLTEKGAKIYLANLELGQSSVFKIAKRVKINRITTYDVIEKLIRKGFINFITKHGVKYFSPTKPDLIFQNIKGKVDVFQKNNSRT